MKKFEIVDTKENVIETYMKDTIKRNNSLHQFILMIDSLDYNCSIAVDGNWGTGKTFFVKQAIMLLDSTNTIAYYNKKELCSEVIAKYKSYDSEFKIRKNHISVYYDAWINDNHDDPIFSLVYSIIKQFGNSIEESIDVKEILKSIFNFCTNSKMEEIIKAFEKEDYLDNIMKNEDIKDIINTYFNALLAERGDRLNIFVDELDRCSPDYAVRFLERIKHYFNNDKITFIFSVNSTELQHTIKKHYGNEFNGYKYLDRFFDFRISLTQIEVIDYLEYFKMARGGTVVDEMCLDIIQSENLNLREITKFMNLINIVRAKIDVEITRENKCNNKYITAIFVVILICLKLNDSKKFDDFLNGEDNTTLIKLLENSETLNQHCDDYVNIGETNRSNNLYDILETRKEKLNILYNYYFNEQKIDIGVRQMYIPGEKKNIEFFKIISMISDFSNYNT